MPFEVAICNLKPRRPADSPSACHSPGRRESFGAAASRATFAVFAPVFEKKSRTLPELFLPAWTLFAKLAEPTSQYSL